MTITPAQLELRRNAIGSSDAPAIVGASPWKTPLQLWMEKRGAVPDQEPTVAMEVGTALEPYIADRWARDTGLEVRLADTVRDSTTNFLIGHPDRWLVGRNEGLECKAVGKISEDWGPTGTDLVPLHVHIQCDHLLMISAAERWHVAALFGMSELRHYTIERDEALLAKLRSMETEFWQMVQDGVPPPMMNAADARLLYPQDAGTSITARPEIADVVLALRNLRAARAAQDAVEDEMVEVIQKFMGPHATLLDAAGNVLVTWKTTKEISRLDSAALGREHPDLIRQFQKLSPGTRRFIVKTGDTR